MGVWGLFDFSSISGGEKYVQSKVLNESQVELTEQVSGTEPIVA